MSIAASPTGGGGVGGLACYTRAISFLVSLSRCWAPSFTCPRDRQQTRVCALVRQRAVNLIDRGGEKHFHASSVTSPPWLNLVFPTEDKVMHRSFFFPTTLYSLGARYTTGCDLHPSLLCSRGNPVGIIARNFIEPAETRLGKRRRPKASSIESAQCDTLAGWGNRPKASRRPFSAALYVFTLSVSKRWRPLPHQWLSAAGRQVAWSLYQCRMSHLPSPAFYRGKKRQTFRSDLTFWQTWGQRASVKKKKMCMTTQPRTDSVRSFRKKKRKTLLDFHK